MGQLIEERCRDEQDVELGQPFGEAFRIEHIVLPQQMQGRAVQERAPHLERGRVEGNVGGLRDAVAGANRREARILSQLDHRGLRNGDSFRVAGGARRVDDVGELLRRRSNGRLRDDLAGTRPVVVNADRPRMHRQRFAELGFDQQDVRSRVGEHEGEALWRVVRVERQVGGAGLEDAEERDHHVERALDAEPDDGLGAGAERAQMVGELVRADVELAVAQRLVVEHERDGVGRAGGLFGEQLRDGGVRNGTRGVVPGGEDGAALVRRQNVEAADRRVGRRHCGGEQPGRAAPPSPRRSPRRTGRWHIPARPRCRQACRPRRAPRPAQTTGRTWRSPPGRPRTRCAAPAARGSPGRRSGTPASPGTADDATASAPG